MYSSILCPVDGSESSNHGLAEAIRLAEDQGARLHLLHVVDNSPFLMYMPATATVGNFEVARESGRQILEQAKSQAAEHHVDATTETVEILTGRPGPAIVEAAAKVAPDLIVMGTNGRRGLSRLLVGSDAAAVVSEAPAPVLLVR